VGLRVIEITTAEQVYCGLFHAQGIGAESRR